MLRTLTTAYFSFRAWKQIKSYPNVKLLRKKQKSITWAVKFFLFPPCMENFII